MIIYGVALLAICTMAGVIIGDFLGMLLGVKSNVGGVGIAMLLLMAARLYMERSKEKGGVGMSKGCELGVGFWGAMYIPVVVAMAAQQNVVAALHGGPVVLVAAFGSVLLCGVTIAIISRTNKGEPLPDEKLPVGVLLTPAGGR